MPVCGGGQGVSIGTGIFGLCGVCGMVTLESDKDAFEVMFVDCRRAEEVDVCALFGERKGLFDLDGGAKQPRYAGPQIRITEEAPRAIAGSRFHPVSKSQSKGRRGV